MSSLLINSAILSSTALSGTGLQSYRTQYNTIVQNNTLTYRLSSSNSYLNIPVYEYGFDHANKIVSEFKYTDNYQYQESIFVLNSNLTPNLSTSNYKKSEYWLTGLTRSNYVTTLQETKETYSTLWSSTSVSAADKKIDWTSNGNRTNPYGLKDILDLSLPSRKQSPFTYIEKEINLKHNYAHKPEYKLYSGYWNKGKISAGNLYPQIEFGKIKDSVNLWHDIYPNQPHNIHNKWPSCSEIGRLNNSNIRTDHFLGEGFDSICGNIGLRKKGMAFGNHQRQLYTSGYVAYKDVWDHYQPIKTYYYILGDLKQYNTHKHLVNQYSSNKNLWYVSYDGIFKPNIKTVDDLNKNISLTIDMAELQQAAIENFLIISSGLKFALEFLVNGNKKTLDFTLDDVVNATLLNIPYTEDVEDVTISNFKLQVASNNKHVHLINQVDNDFTYTVNNSGVKAGYKLYNQIIAKQPESKTYFYSELIENDKLKNFFYLTNNNQKNKEKQVGNYLWSTMNITKWGKDTETRANFTYLDPIERHTKSFGVTNLLTLPELKYDAKFRPNSYSSLREHLKKQNTSVDNNYFWSKLKIIQIEKNLLEGYEVWVLKSNHSDPEIKAAWDNFYNDKKMTFINGDNKFLRPKSELKDWAHKIYNTSETYKDNFALTDLAKKHNYSIDDFKFTKTEENDSWIAIMVEDIKVKQTYLTKSKKTFKIYKNPPQPKSRTSASFPVTTTSYNSATPVLSENTAFSPNVAADKTNEKPANKHFPIIFSMSSIAFAGVSLLCMQTISSFRVRKIF